MSNIVAKTQSGKEIIVETFVSNVREALEYWKTMGMTNVTYFAKKVKFIPKKV